MNIAEAKIPDSRLTAIGVPHRPEKIPSSRGPAPSYEATAWARSAPMIQVVPLDSSAQMNPAAAIVPSTLPVPVRVAVTVPSAAVLTSPPYTVNTVLIASTNPPRLVIWSAGSTSRIDRIGMPYASTATISARRIVYGTSFCASFISSPAALGSSNPTKLKNSTGTAAMNTAQVGLKSLPPTPCTPFCTAYRNTVTVKTVSRITRPQAPIVGIHLPTPNDRIAAQVANQMKASAKR